MRIVMASEGPRIPAAAIGSRPLGGAETAFALLAEALAVHHDVQVEAGEEPPERLGRVAWAPPGTALAAGETPDLVIATRVPRLFGRLPRTGRRVLWLHNPADYLTKPRHLVPLLRARPILVTLGAAHRATLPAWLPGRRVIIPLAVAPPFDQRQEPRVPPPPVAIFTSNPMRGLDWLLIQWATRIRSAVPWAELHLYSSAATYGGDAQLALRATSVLARAAAMGAAGVVIQKPLPRPALAERLRGARAMLYRGDAGETFCLALAEAQAQGLPCVVTNLGAVAERIVDGETGTIAADPEAFSAAAIRLLSDDALWSAQHAAALARGPGPGWPDVAAQFADLAG
jgi:hypothetical protein